MSKTSDKPKLRDKISDQPLQNSQDCQKQGESEKLTVQRRLRRLNVRGCPGWDPGTEKDIRRN